MLAAMFVRRSRTAKDVDALSIDARGPVLEAARKVTREQDPRDDCPNDQTRSVPTLPARTREPRCCSTWDRWW